MIIKFNNLNTSIALFRLLLLIFILKMETLYNHFVFKSKTLKVREQNVKMWILTKCFVKDEICRASDLIKKKLNQILKIN